MSVRTESAFNRAFKREFDRLPRGTDANRKLRIINMPRLPGLEHRDSLIEQISNGPIHLAQATHSRRIPRFARAALSDQT